MFTKIATFVEDSFNELCDVTNDTATSIMSSVNDELAKYKRINNITPEELEVVERYLKDNKPVVLPVACATGAVVVSGLILTSAAAAGVTFIGGTVYVISSAINGYALGYLIEDHDKFNLVKDNAMYQKMKRTMEDAGVVFEFKSI